MKHGEKIKLDDKVITVYECDRKATCKNSRYCGKECKFTADKKHAVLYQQLSIFNEVIL